MTSATQPGTQPGTRVSPSVTAWQERVGGTTETWGAERPRVWEVGALRSSSQSMPSDTHYGESEEVSRIGSDDSSVEDAPDDSDGQDGLRVLDGLPEQWPTVYAAVVHVRRPDDSVPPCQKVRVTTLCAGTDSPVKGFGDVIGNDNVEHVASCEIMPAAREFSMATSRPAMCSTRWRDCWN